MCKCVKQPKASTECDDASDLEPCELSSEETEEGPESESGSSGSLLDDEDDWGDGDDADLEELHAAALQEFLGLSRSQMVVSAHVPELEPHHPEEAAPEPPANSQDDGDEPFKLDSSGLVSVLIDGWDDLEEWLALEREDDAVDSPHLRAQLDEGVQCPICFEPVTSDDILLQASVFSGCRHIGHWRCLKPWLDEKGTCPTCRADVWRCKVKKVDLRQGTLEKNLLPLRQEWLTHEDMLEIAEINAYRRGGDGFEDPGRFRLLCQHPGHCL
mmetsp:Transcript_4836/g.10680  ORF Transcript_4836/g.10680 Transcript_4836/m.10680 type:complete len:271 (+) Transcript_4836:83-895(+)